MQTSFANSMVGFCFPVKVSLNDVKNHLSAIMAPHDKVFLRESLNCIETSISERRVTLFRNWLKRKYRIVDEYSVYQGNKRVQTVKSHTISKDHCKLELTRKIKTNSNTTIVDARKNGRIARSERSADGERKSNLMLMSGRMGSIEIDQQEVSLTCHYRNANRYLLDINIRDFDASLMTTVEITSGQKVNIGEIVENINRKSRGINNKGIGFNTEKTKGRSTYTYFVTIK